MTYDASGVLVKGEVSIEGVCEVNHRPNVDPRGFLLRVFDSNLSVVQESISHTEKKGTLRGLHVQLEQVESKMITSLHGTMQWVVVDLRGGSSTFRRWKSFNLHPYKTLLVGKGFAHGCLSLTHDCTLLIRADEEFNSQAGRGIHWKDKDLAVEWEFLPHMVSARDEAYKSFTYFVKTYGEL